MSLACIKLFANFIFINYKNIKINYDNNKNSCESYFYYILKKSTKKVVETGK